MKAFVLICAALVLAASFHPAARAETSMLHVAAGVNGAWLAGPNAAFPADLEAGGNAWQSISPHISAVGGAYWGFSHSYARYQGGARLTLSDVDNPNLSSFLGVIYRGGSTSAVGPNEWAGDAGFGWRPSPTRYPLLTFVGDASFGLTSNRVLAYLGLRYQIPLH